MGINLLRRGCVSLVPHDAQTFMVPILTSFRHFFAVFVGWVCIHELVNVLWDCRGVVGAVCFCESLTFSTDHGRHRGFTGVGSVNVGTSGVLG